MELKIEGKRALVCGATAGIGWATAQALAKEGVVVTLFARNKTKLQHSLKELEGEGHSYLVADFSNIKNVEKALAGITHNFHILINNTGGPSGGEIAGESIEKFQNTIEQHLLVNHLLVQKLMPFMKTENYGRIINVTSISVKSPIVGLGVSNTTRWAVTAWAKTLSKELSHTGITVNSLLPGFTKTDRMLEVTKAKAEQAGITHEAFLANLKTQIPSGDFVEPSHIAEMACFLCSMQGSSINGAAIPIDGGFLDVV